MPSKKKKSIAHAFIFVFFINEYMYKNKDTKIGIIPIKNKDFEISFPIRGFKIAIIVTK